MIVNEFDPKHGLCSLTIESAEDLWTLRRLIRKGDVVVTRSSRVVKREEEYSRPDKGERVKVTIALEVDDVHLDSSVERLRLRGAILEASDESVPKTGSHSVALSAGHALSIRKDSWTPVEVALVRPPGERTRRFMLVAADRREAGIGVLSGSHLSIATTVESGLGGKQGQGQEQSPRPYIAKVVDLIGKVHLEGDQIVVAGPGNFKNTILNETRARLKGGLVTAVEGFDLTGADGVRALVKAPAFQALAKDSVMVEAQKLVDEVVTRISRGDRKVAYALPMVVEAAGAGAVEACAMSDDVFSAGMDEGQLVDVLNTIEAKGGRVYLVDSTMEFGKQVSSFGGIVALLRYAVRA